MKVIFWTSIIFIFYTYLGYPLILLILSKLSSKEVKKGVVQKDVSVVIAVRNEEKKVIKRIDNILNQTYSNGKVEVIIVSDGSTDCTDDIVKLYSKEVLKGVKISRPEIKLISYSSPQGKPYALNVGVQKAAGEIIVFADARQEFQEQAISELVNNFNDPTVGCVSGELVFYENSNSSIKQEIDMYWNYEKYIRKLESTIHSLPGATGAIYAIRKSLFTPMPKELLLDDVYIPMNVVLKGYRTIFDATAVAYDTVSTDFAMERRRKIRTLLGNWQLLRILPNLLWLSSNPIFFQYISHKVFRLIVPFCFISYLITSLLIGLWFYKLLFCLTFSFFLVSLLKTDVPWIKPLNRISSAARAILNLNYCALISFWYFIKRKEQVWN